jgi:hypothetical protein
MPPTIDLEREFFKAVKDIDTYSKAKKQFMAKIKEISESWIDRKFCLGVLGLKHVKDRESYPLGEKVLAQKKQKYFWCPYCMQWADSCSI